MADHSNLNLDAIRDTMVTIALDAGRMMLECDHSRIILDSKLSSHDLVTEVDRAVETMVSTKLREAYPTFDFVGEETYKPGDKLTNAPTFIVDPIDGTTNFVHGLPAACISLGLAVDRHPVAGVIYNPWTDELFTGRRGGGSWLRCRRSTLISHNDKQPLVEATSKPGPAPPKFSYGSDATHQTLRLPLMPPSPLTVRSSVIALAMDTDRSGPNFNNSIEMSRRLLASRESGGAQCQSLRHTGSSALHMAHMAAGHLDAWWQGGPWSWDVCAGWAILEEVGGMVAGPNPGEWHPPLDGRLWFAVRPAPEAEQRAFIEEVWSLQGDLRLNY